ncbi:MAG TPA: hypothetical protein VFQ44_10845 [Streptosporangiaceae bacterium]|nr:hypothetical protein [Streptosporangiaceae bacterium]
MNQVQATEAALARVLDAVPGLSLTAQAARGDDGVDGVLQFAGAQERVAFQIMSRANAATAWQLVHQVAGRLDRPVVLVAGESTADARRILREHGIGFLDGLGNAHIELPGLLVHVEGRQPAAYARPVRLSGKAGVVAQALLLHEGQRWQVQDLAEETRVSDGLVHRVLVRLEAENLVASAGTGNRRYRYVTDPSALLDVWAEEDMHRPERTHAFVLAQGPRQLAVEVNRSLSDRGFDHALTGAAAASFVVPFITAVPVADVWVTAGASPGGLLDAVGGEPADTGSNVVFLQVRDDTPLVFRDLAAGLWLVNRFRLYADLRRDPRRGQEQAAHLRREVIGF